MDLKGVFKKLAALSLSSLMAVSCLNLEPISAIAAEAGSDLGAVTNISKDGNEVFLTYESGAKSKITFLENNIFRFNVELDGEFDDFPAPVNKSDTATIVQQPDDSDEYTKPEPGIDESGSIAKISTDKIELSVNKTNATMQLTNKETGKVVWQEAEPISIDQGNTTQKLIKTSEENYFGGGTQNGRFNHTGKSISIINNNNYTDGGVSSPNPFYWSTAGYGVIRNTFKQGVYDFGKTDSNDVIASHEETRFDAYYLVDTEAESILNDYYKVTGNPVLFPEQTFYLGHLNCYNRDAWYTSEQGDTDYSWVEKDDKGNDVVKTSKIKNIASKWKLEDGNQYFERGATDPKWLVDGEVVESLNGTTPLENNTTDYKYSARAVIDGYADNDMPLGWFLPNDGYGCGYGQNGLYQSTSGGYDYTAQLNANVQNLGDFTDYAESKGVTTGLWTQSALTPQAGVASGQTVTLLRDFEKEVKTGGIRTLKTDVAWVGSGYSFGLNGIRYAYNTIAETGDRPTIVTLDGWAGTQRYGGIWTGDQYGGDWEYIRFHIPTYIGQSLSGNPNVSSDMDGIFSGSALITTRDYQWKTFTTQLLDMDGWGSYPKKPYTFGEDYTSIIRNYQKLRSQLMPYIYTTAYESTTGLPQVRAMFLEYPDEAYAYTEATQYQYMFGSSFLVAPVYQDTAADSEGNDVRNGIYLPDEDQIWIDYFTGDQYRGGQVVNNFDAPIWKMPLFVKNGSIVPMYTENNNAQPITEDNPKGLDKTKRIIEFWPAGSTSYDLYEDDGNSVDNSNEEQPVYGSSVTTHFTSVVENKTATLTAEASKGSYDGYDANRDTTFVVNVSEKPDAVTAAVGGKNITLTEVTSEEEFEKAEGNVYFYNEKPNLNQYSTEGSDFEKQEIIINPQVNVKIAKTDVSKNDIKVTIEGFVNDGNLRPDEVNDLSVPQNLSAPEDSLTPTSVLLTWEAVEGATGYEVEVDGLINSGINDIQYNNVDLDYHSTHTYRVRAVNATGYSAWSDEITATTSLDPYRNVPEDIKLTWEYGDSWGALENALDYNNGSMFHSTGDAIGKPLIMDMKQYYTMDKLVYLARGDNFGNGTVKQMDMYVSLDGVNWKKVHDGTKDNWTYDSSKPNDDPVNAKTIYFGDNVKARYIKLVPLKSTGNFFSAAEIQPYATEGRIGHVVGDFAGGGDGAVNEADYQLLTQYAGLTSKDPDFSYVAGLGTDVDYNNVIDAYDAAWIMSQLDGGTTKSGKASGKVLVTSNKKEVKAGETFTLSMVGINIANINAFGAQLPYDPTQLEFVSASGGNAVSSMVNWTKNKQYEDSGVVVVSYTNRGDQPLASGKTVSMASVSFKAKTDFTVEDLNVEDLKLIGPKMDYVDGKMSNDTTIPDTPSTTEEFKETTKVSITNDVLPTDDGSNVSKLIQQGSFASLTDGDTGDEGFELKWDVEGNQVDGVLAAEVTLPVTLHFDFDNEVMNQIKVYARKAGNGAPRVVSAKATTSDGEVIDLGTIGKMSDDGKRTFTEYPADGIFVFDLDESKEIANVDVTFTHSTGDATSDPEHTHDRMLTLSEVTFANVVSKPATGITLDKNNESTIYAGSMVSFAASITPADALNPYYTVTSSDDEVVQVIMIKDGSNISYMLKGLKDGKAVITATSADNKELSASMEVTVKAGADTTDLKALVEKAEAYSEAWYTTDSWSALQTAITAAKEVIDGEPSDQDVADATANLDAAIKALVEVEKQGINFADIKNITALYSETNTADLMFDGNLATFWESPYNGDTAKLPQDVVIEFNNAVKLGEMVFTSHTIKNGGVTSYQISTSIDGSTWDLAYEGLVDASEYLQGKNVTVDAKFAPVEAKFVKLTVTGAVGRLESENDKYARIAEMSLYTIGSVQTETDFTALTAALKAANKKELQGYDDDTTTPSTWNVYKAAYATANTLSKQEDASQADVDAASDALTKATEALALKATSAMLKNLQLAIDNLSALKDSYTVAEFALAQQAIDQAQAVLANEDVNEITSNSVDEASTALSQAKNSLTHNTYLDALRTLTAVAKEVMTSDEIDTARPGQVENLKAAIKAAEDLITANSSDVTAIDHATTNLYKALHELYKIVDKTNLNNLIAGAEGLTESKYTVASWEAVKTALAAAKDVAANDDATSEDVQNAYDALTRGIAELQLAADKTALKDAMDMADTILANAAKYVSSTISNLQNVYNEAKAVYDDANASTADIQAATTKLITENAKARLKADKTVLKEEVEKANKLNLNNYTKASAEAVTTALEAANAVLNNEAATEEEVNKALSTLQAAVSKLETPSNAQNKTEASAKNPVNSGDSTNAAGLGMMMLLAGCYVALRYYAKRKEN